MHQRAQTGRRRFDFQRLQRPGQGILVVAYARLRAQADQLPDGQQRIELLMQCHALFDFNAPAFAESELGRALMFFSTPEYHLWRLRFTLGAGILFLRHGDPAEAVEGAIYWLRAALVTRVKEVSPVDWARTHGELATAYKNRRRGDHAENFRLARQHLDQALTEFTPEGQFDEWLHTIKQSALLRLQAKPNSPIERLTATEVAIGELETVVAYADPEKDILLWGSSMDALAQEYSTRAIGLQFENIEKAHELYRRLIPRLEQHAGSRDG